jgi:transposase
LEDAGERIIQLYQSWGKTEMAAKWQKKLQEAKRSFFETNP